MGAANYTQAQTFDGNQSVGIAVFQLPGTNALDVADRVKAKMAELKERFPEGVDYQIAYDITPFIRESVADVVKTLFEAVGLVGLVVLAFLQNWRSVLIPMIAVPVAIIGTFAAMAVVGFSLNNISLFGLVLAIGIVVDDAIVVVENVDRWLDHGLPPREAARKAMTEVTGPIIAVALVLCAVFVPCAFISGITGRFFRQFAVTIAVSTVFSAINSLTLSPALAAILLRKKKREKADSAGRRRRRTSSAASTGRFRRTACGLRCSPAAACSARGFNAAFGRTTAGYAWSVGKLLRVNVVVLLRLCGAPGLDLLCVPPGPAGLRPAAGPGPGHRQHSTPRRRLAAADAERAGRRSTTIARHTTPGVAHTITVAGYSFVQQANGSNFASMFIVLDPFDKRTTPALRDTAIMNSLRRAWSQQIKDAQVLVFGSPPVPGLSVAGGFKLVVEDPERPGIAHPGKANQRPGRKAVAASRGWWASRPSSAPRRRSSSWTSTGPRRPPWAFPSATWTRRWGSISDRCTSTVSTPSAAIGRSMSRPRASTATRSRTSICWRSATIKGRWCRWARLADVRQIGGPIFVYRYNSRTATSITGSLKPGVSSGEVIADVDRLAGETLPLSMKTEWTELMFMQIRDGDTTLYVFALAVMCVFLALCRALRKLVVAAGGDPGRAVVPALFHGRRAG